MVSRSEPATQVLTRQRVLGAVRRVVGAVTEAEGVALVFDDVDAADEATVDVLVQLAAARFPALLVVLAYRAERAPPALDRRAALRSARGGSCGSTSRPCPPPMPRRWSSPPRRQTRHDRRKSKRSSGWLGNPFFIVGLARKGRPRGHALLPPM